MYPFIELLMASLRQAALSLKAIHRLLIKNLSHPFVPCSPLHRYPVSHLPLHLQALSLSPSASKASAEMGCSAEVWCKGEQRRGWHGELASHTARGSVELPRSARKMLEWMQR